MADETLSVGLGTKRLEARGPSGLLALVAMLALVGAGLLVWQHDAQTRTDHHSIAREIRVQTCLLSLTAEERVSLRSSLAQTTRPLQALRLWCPWLDALNGDAK